VIFFGHMGFSSMGAYLLDKTTPSKRNFKWRYVLLFAILPDLIDKPLKFMIPAFEASRSIGHSILALCILWTLITFKKRSPYYVVAYFLHFVCDAMWGFLPALLWPFLGFAVDPPEILTRTEYFSRLFSPLYISFEVIGLLFLFYIFKMKKQTL
jgi:hypothetical protein